MGDREVPFDEEEICDICGARGAFDFYGDLYCQKCLDKIIARDDGTCWVKEHQDE